MQLTSWRGRTKSAGSPPVSAPTSSSSTRRTGAISPITWVVSSSTPSSRPARSCSNARHNRTVATKKQRRRREKEARHEYEFVYVDHEGNEVEGDETAVHVPA